MLSLVSYQPILEGNRHKKMNEKKGWMLSMLSSTFEFLRRAVTLESFL